MKFFALHVRGVEEKRLDLLRSACHQIKIPFVPLDPTAFDFSKPSPVRKGDIVYRVSRGKMLRFFEDFLVRPGVVTFYSSQYARKPHPFLLEKCGIPVPDNILCVTNDRKQLEQYVKKLGGFPVVLKALGGTRGMGVMKVDSMSSLISMAGFLLQQGKFFFLRKFLPVKSSARFIVLGTKVVASLEYRATNGDFRTNSGNILKVKQKKFPRDLEELAVLVTSAMGWEFGGVDVLVYQGKAYVSEVNFPCNFVRAQDASKKDIALMMVKYLAEKAKG
ncbi:MAG: hypothetical protein U0519_01465 [Candidatus Gracilibacteria bacterium]